MGMSIDNLYFGHPIYIATKEWQRRRHRKKRINKKWLKRYGTYELNLMPHNQVVMTDEGVIWMTKQTYQKLVGTLGGKKNEGLERNRKGRR